MAQISPIRPPAAGSGGARIGVQAAARRRRGWRFHPTGSAKSDPKHHQFPTNAGHFPGYSAVRWGVLWACGAKRRNASNGAGFSIRQSLHIWSYRKLRVQVLDSIGLGANPIRRRTAEQSYLVGGSQYGAHNLRRIKEHQGASCASAYSSCNTPRRFDRCRHPCRHLFPCDGTRIPQGFPGFAVVSNTVDYKVPIALKIHLSFCPQGNNRRTAIF